MAQIVNLPERLRTIVGFIQNGASIIDVGTDHGLLPAYLAQNGAASHIIASDISIGSLGSAHHNAAKYGVTDKITFIEASGLSGIRESDVDTIVIAGMGGETIAGILRDAPWTRRSDIRLILQPQTKLPELCDFLRQAGYALQGAKLSLDAGKLYVIMLVHGGKSDSALAPELELLARLMHSEDPLLGRYLDELMNRTRRILDDMSDSGTPEALDLALKLSVYINMKETLDRG